MKSKKLHDFKNDFIQYSRFKINKQDQINEQNLINQQDFFSVSFIRMKIKNRMGKILEKNKGAC